MITLKNIFGIAWRSVLVTVGYITGLMLAGMIAALLGMQMATSMRNESAFTWLVISSLLIGAVLGPLAARLALTRVQHLLLWASVIFFNLGSVAIEGAYFVPELVPLPIPFLFAQQALASVSAALVIVLLFVKVGAPVVSWLIALRTRPWYSWVWRFLLSAFSYLTFYFVFGALNYALVTKPYYESHAGGLTVPAPEIVLAAELVRAPLIVLSILLFLLSARGSKRQLMLQAGWLLFAIGGLVPVILQISTLPLFLLFASTIEIFSQNFLTGVVAAGLLGIEATALDNEKNKSTADVPLKQYVSSQKGT